MPNFGINRVLWVFGVLMLVLFNLSMYKLFQNYDLSPNQSSSVVEVNLDQDSILERTKNAINAFKSHPKEEEEVPIIPETQSGVEQIEHQPKKRIDLKVEDEEEEEEVQLPEPTTPHTIPPLIAPNPLQIPVKKDLVIGMALAIATKNLAVFVKSLREHCSPSEADVVLIMDRPTSDSILKLIDEYSVTPVYFTPAESSSSELDFSMHPSSYRWPMISSYLSTHMDQYSKVLMADIRDTYFQANPFKLLSSSSSSLLTWNEGDKTMIKNCGWNSGWIRDCFGESALKTVYNQPIICSGISLGWMQAAVQYTKLMSDLIMGRMKEFQLFPSCERNGIDQGVHNFIFHRHLLASSSVSSDGSEIVPLVLSQESGLVIHLQQKLAIVRYDVTLSSKSSSSSSSSSLVLNTKQQPAVIVHQYDRDKRLQALLFDLYANDDDDEEAGAAKDCVGFTWGREGFDVFKGICDLGKVAVVEAKDCCRACNANGKCLGFTFYDGACFLKSCKESVEVRINGAVSGTKK